MHVYLTNSLSLSKMTTDACSVSKLTEGSEELATTKNISVFSVMLSVSRVMLMSMTEGEVAVKVSVSLRGT